MNINFKIDFKFNKNLIVFMVLILALQMAYIKYHHSGNFQSDEIDKKIQYNLENENELEETIVNELNSRVALLKSMSYNDWIKYNDNAPYIFYDTDKEYKYWIQAWRSIPNTDFFQLKVYPDLKFINHSWHDIVDYNSMQFTSNHFDYDKDLIKKFMLSGEKPYSTFQFYTYDPVYHHLVQRKEFVIPYDDGDGNRGTISSGYDVKNVNESYTFDHFRNPTCLQLYIGSVFLTIFLTLMIYFFNSDNESIAMTKATIFYTIFMLYISYYMTIDDELGTVEIELKKLEGVSQGILSLSFMTGLSIFILNTIKNKSFLYRETTFLLIVYMISIIIILFKNNAYNRLEDITNYRIMKEFGFNYCILINMFIVINFGINVFTEKKNPILNSTENIEI